MTRHPRRTKRKCRVNYRNVHSPALGTQSEGQQQVLDFLQPRFGVRLRQARELAAQGDVIALARQHQLVVLDLDDGDALVGGQDFQFGDLQQQVHRRRHRAEPVAQFARQTIQRDLVGRLRQLAVDLDAMLRFGNVVVRQSGSRVESRGPGQRVGHV